MLKHVPYPQARDLLLNLVSPVAAQPTALDVCQGRVLAEDFIAAENVPAFDRSPYDGYAFCAEDTAAASASDPVVLRVVAELPAGSWPNQAVTPGTAVRIMTGAPIPEGADAVEMFEKTRFTDRSVSIFSPSRPGQNIIRAGEDVAAGQLLAEAGSVIDPGLAGTLAAQGIFAPLVFRRPKIGLISTGSEIMDSTDTPPDGKLRNSNRFTLGAALIKAGCEPFYLGLAEDRVQDIRALIERGLACCDGVLLTGGVSVGDYDLTPEAMQQAGVEIKVFGVDMKPGMACAFGVRSGRQVWGLSGNPASSMTTFYAVVLPVLRRLCGRKHVLNREIQLTLASNFKKSSKSTRLLRGTLDLSDGTARIILPEEQGNVVLSSAIGCDVMAIVPAGSGPLAAGTRLKGFMI